MGLFSWLTFLVIPLFGVIIGVYNVRPPFLARMMVQRGFSRHTTGILCLQYPDGHVEAYGALPDGIEQGFSITKQSASKKKKSDMLEYDDIKRCRQNI